MKKYEFYKCDLCNNVVEVLEGTGPKLHCCGQEMKKLEEQTADSTTEKHVPYIEEKENGYLVKVGKEVAHPMTEAHFIEMIELTVDGTVYKKYLKPTDKPEAMFIVEKGNLLSAREYCNLHGLWAA